MPGHGVGCRAPVILKVIGRVMISSMVQWVRRMFADFDVTHREKATALTVMEMEELENIFALLVLGSFAGFPSPPTFIAVELLPYMERELQILCKRAKECNDMLAEMCGTIGID
jgi:hypothetical protein